MIVKTTLRVIATIAVAATFVVGCGYSEDEWQAQLAKYETLAQKHEKTESELQKTKKALERTENELEAERRRVAQLEKDLEDAGFDLNRLNETLSKRGTKLEKLNQILEEREKALALYKERAKQLERIKARFAKLRSKLDELTNLGLEVSVRNNRMVISLPGDVLFESGQDRLKEDGEEVLGKVAGIIQGDASLKKRYYQVAGHTDNVALKSGGIYKDNWGLSLMRARTVLLYLIEQGLPRDKWSAAGFADTDPRASNDTRQGRQKNRRCEVVVVPSAEEMLDLKNIVG